VSENKKKVLVGISMGDFNGIGPEVILRTFEDKRMFDFFTVIVFGNTLILQKTAKLYKLPINIRSVGNDNKILNKVVNVIDVTENIDIELRLGQPTSESGRLAVLALEEASHDLINDKIKLLVTAPIDKQNSFSEEFPYRGHTEFLKDFFEQDTLMIMVSDGLRVALATEHVPLLEVPNLITEERISHKINQVFNSLRSDFAIKRPKIAILGLNPHSGDKGVMGTEEQEIISPVIKQFREKEHLVFGPFSADGFFASGIYAKYDAVLAMYHDQGLIPFKSLAFGSGVNFTAGLNRVRTSPDHGTAFDIAGKNKANASSFRKSLFIGREIYFNRLSNQFQA